MSAYGNLNGQGRTIFGEFAILISLTGTGREAQAKSNVFLFVPVNQVTRSRNSSRNVMEFVNPLHDLKSCSLHG